MMSIYDILNVGLGGKGPEEMWRITKMMSDCIEEYLPEDKKERLKGRVYYSVHGGHFDREYAGKVVSRFYYTDSLGVKHQSPYWTVEDVRPIYDEVRAKIPGYNVYDFWVAMNMVKSDNCNKLERWFPDYSDEELLDKLVDETVNYLDDEDNPNGSEKLWKYLNA